MAYCRKTALSALFPPQNHLCFSGLLGAQPDDKQLQGPRIAGDGGARHVLDVPAAEDGADDLLDGPRPVVPTAQALRAEVAATPSR